MMDHLRPALVMIGLMTALTGLAYPLAMTGLAQAAFPTQANASLMMRDGQIVGSALVAQDFDLPHYAHPRPSANVYDAAASGASNLGATSAILLADISDRAAAYRQINGTTQVPIDAVTASGSGLDPHVSVENALLQARRIAEARGVPVADVRRVIDALAEGPWLGLFGEAHVNVLRLNLALDDAFPLSPPEGEAVEG
ncbi:potassium-transporting ATPase subunit KdpC [Paracoccus sp. NSM]|uniref:potassium-transporting ATPase subunit KdpC n=1 Tax=Paracoccus sp. NSM TaxID=3457784 RepID=UPI0040371557